MSWRRRFGARPIRPPSPRALRPWLDPAAQRTACRRTCLYRRHPAPKDRGDISGRRQRRLRALLRRPFLKRAAGVKSLRIAISPGKLIVDIDGASRIFAPRRLRVRRNKPVHDRLHGFGFRSCEINPAGRNGGLWRIGGSRLPGRAPFDDFGPAAALSDHQDRRRRQNISSTKIHDAKIQLFTRDNDRSPIRFPAGRVGVR